MLLNDQDWASGAAMGRVRREISVAASDIDENGAWGVEPEARILQLEKDAGRLSGRAVPQVFPSE